ncbi:undecaprenyl/decaprenyl-phosphate alpha-N-acetylglucosaminyl 1-phosphate transferase [Virgibacillus sp. MSP4-1]|uniref:glycosyltransferase family 4 protein n=1 Tax=Virgibacillus sp. MSP4-1 TaxID=2700081 RepID=UPI000399AB84|nr:MraY family glycosyltransferase [Virgibacillus sp. MSP4-1]QHS23504.1 undecaprenyl/decaprenyl-phosphate alpha-N-acetylglucosaminyl 1-phosphate transferase [Virgibacillus sp. MSP4-1]
MLYISILVCFLMALVITPLVKQAALKINAVDLPAQRKVHDKTMPRLGGLAIYFSFLAGLMLFYPDHPYLWTIGLGATLTLCLGVIDDVIGLSSGLKFMAQTVIAILVVVNGVQIDFITLPFGPRIDFGVWSIPITVFWIVAITNAMNLIDGLDGLAAGVSSIVLITISGMAIAMGNMFVAVVGLMLLGSTLGFLVFNFYPARIFLGDTGSYFLGFMISTLSILGLFKNVTFFSIIVPIIILGVPLVDTTFAVVRRIIQGKPVSAPDKSHLHHCLIRLGYSHRKSVLMIYGLSGIFSIAAIIFTRSTMWGSMMILVALAVLIELTVEITGLISQNYRPLLNLVSGKRQS